MSNKSRQNKQRGNHQDRIRRYLRKYGSETQSALPEATLPKLCFEYRSCAEVSLVNCHAPPAMVAAKSVSAPPDDPLAQTGSA